MLSGAQLGITVTRPVVGFLAEPSVSALQTVLGELAPKNLARPVPELSPHDTVAHAVEQLRPHRASLAVVRDDTGRLTGLVSLDDLLARLMEPCAA